MVAGRLDQNNFSYTSLDPASLNDSLPLSVRLDVYIFGTYLNVTLNQIQGAVSVSSLKSQVFIKENLNSPIKKLNLAKLVSYFLGKR
jgi:hypothetical protein